MKKALRKTSIFGGLFALAIMGAGCTSSAPIGTSNRSSSITPTAITTDIAFLPGQSADLNSKETVHGTKIQEGFYQIVYNEHTITISIGTETDRISPTLGLPVQEWPVTFKDELGHTQSFVRTYVVNGDSTARMSSTEPAIYLDDRTYAYVSSDDSGDPLRHTLEFSDKGLYVWVYQGLYYYDPTTGTFGLDLDMIP